MMMMMMMMMTRYINVRSKAGDKAYSTYRTTQK